MINANSAHIVGMEENKIGGSRMVLKQTSYAADVSAQIKLQIAKTESKL